MSRILVLSDIHANIDALTAIDEPHDAVLFLGDIVDYGPAPAECIAHLQAEENLLRVRGNHDNAVAFRVDCGCGEAYLHLSTATREQMWRLLDEEQFSWVGGAGTSMQLESGGKRIFAVHAAPSDNLFKYVTPETTDAELSQEAALAGDADIVIMGHTHRPFVRTVSVTQPARGSEARDKTTKKLMVNIGSVGQPRDGIATASYAVIEAGEVELKRAEYDIEAAVGRLRELPLEERVFDELAYILRHAGMPR